MVVPFEPQKTGTFSCSRGGPGALAADFRSCQNKGQGL